MHIICFERILVKDLVSEFERRPYTPVCNDVRMNLLHYRKAATKESSGGSLLGFAIRNDPLLQKGP